MSWAPDRAVVITLARRPDRLAAFAEHAGHLGFDYEVATALEDEIAPDNYGASPAAYSNARAHRQVLRSSRGTVLTFEDDALIPPDFQDRMAHLLAGVPPRWELLLLGGEIMSWPSQRPGGVLQLNAFCRTHAYVVRGPAIAVAERAAREATNHWDSALSNLICSRGTAYAPSEFFVRTTGASSDIPDSRPLDGRAGAVMSGSGSGRRHAPPLRQKQRDDGAGIEGHARLSLAAGCSSYQRNAAPRLLKQNSYL